MCAREFGPSRLGLVTFEPGRGALPLIGLYLCRDWSIPSPEPVQRPPPMLSRRVKPAGNPTLGMVRPHDAGNVCHEPGCKCTGRKRSVLPRGCRAELRLNGVSGM